MQAAAALGQSRPFGWALLEPDLTLATASPNFQTLTGIGETQFLGQPIADLLWEFVGAEEALAQVLAGEPGFNDEQGHLLNPTLLDYKQRVRRWL